MERLREYLKKCVRCGQCRSVCPVFQVIRQESASPRGKVYLCTLLATGKERPSRRARHHLSLCLLCRSCSAECPSGVPVHRLVEASRTTPVTSALIYRYLLANPHLLEGAARLLRFLQILHPLASLAPEHSLLRYLTVLPRPSRPARRMLPETVPARGKARAKVGYFLGCGTNHFFPATAISAVKTLAAAGCEVVIPHDTRCCGLPHLAAGERRTAEKLAQHNLKIFQKAGVDLIITDCASCCTTLREAADGVHEEPLPEIVDLNFFLAHHLFPETRKCAVTNGTTVTYHDPCHSFKGQGIFEEPRTVIQNTPGLVYVEMPDSTLCCGGGGTFAIHHPQVSMQILQLKINSIRATGVQTVLTSCPSCMIQLRRGLHAAGLQLKVAHPVELLAERLVPD